MTTDQLGNSIWAVHKIKISACRPLHRILLYRAARFANRWSDGLALARMKSVDTINTKYPIEIPSALSFPTFWHGALRYGDNLVHRMPQICISRTLVAISQWYRCSQCREQRQIHHTIQLDLALTSIQIWRWSMISPSVVVHYSEYPNKIGTSCTMLLGMSVFIMMLASQVNRWVCLKILSQHHWIASSKVIVSSMAHAKAFSMALAKALRLVVSLAVLSEASYCETT